MAGRFSESEKPFVINQPSLEERLKEYLELKTKIESMLAIIENAGGDVEKAAEAERRIIEGIAANGERGFTQLGPPSATEKGRGVRHQAGRESEGKKALLVHPTGGNRNRRADLHLRSAGAADSTLLRIRGSGVPWVFGSLAASHDGFWGR
jgi:hypothetical protein